MLLYNEDITKPARDVWMILFLIHIIKSKEDNRKREVLKHLQVTGTSLLIY